MKTLQDLFLNELSDIYDAERRIVKALPKMAQAATCDELKSAFQKHLEETKGHVTKLEQVFECFGIKPDFESHRSLELDQLLTSRSASSSSPSIRDNRGRRCKGEDGPIERAALIIMMRLEMVQKDEQRSKFSSEHSP
jgi:hypothetical protein